MDETKSYLGDGVYAKFDGFQIWLTTESGIDTTNEIALEPTVLERLDAFKKRHMGEQNADS